MQHAVRRFGRALKFHSNVFARHPRVSVSVVGARTRSSARVTRITKTTRYLTFTIVNRQVVPDFSTVEWTVRNDGAEADDLGDLGHTRGGIGLLSVDEHTAYLGKHYMDCVIRSNGSVFAARRVAVFIMQDPRPLLALAQRNWTRLRTRRGRRR